MPATDLGPPLRRGPLHGVRIVELPAIGPCPMAALLLSGLGADVIRIARAEPAVRPAWKKDARFDLLYGNRPVLALDLKSAVGREALLSLIDKADALIEGYRPGVCERLGVGPEVCEARNPRLVFGRVTGWGQDGPLAQRAGHDINYLALTGALHAIGPADGAPLPPLNLVADFAGGSMFLALGVVSALFEARASGRGQVVDAAMVDGVHVLMTMFHGFFAGGMHTDERGRNPLDGGSPVYTTYRTLDGRYVAVGALEPQFYAELVAKLGLVGAPEPGLHRLPEHAAVLSQLLRSAFATRTRDEWAAHFEGSDACVTPVLGIGEATLDSHNQARGAFVEVDGIVQPRFAPRFSGTPTDDPRSGAQAALAIGSALQRWGFSLDEADRFARASTSAASTAGVPLEEAPRR